jgi:hypothetical protein
MVEVRGSGSCDGNRRIGILGKRAHTEILLFLDTISPLGSTPTTPLTVPGGPQVGSDVDDSLARRRKRFVTTNVGGRNNIELRNENSEVEGLLTSDNKGGACDDEHENDPDADEAPCDDDFLIQNLLPPRGEPPRRSRRLSTRNVGVGLSDSIRVGE